MAGMECGSKCNGSLQKLRNPLSSMEDAPEKILYVTCVEPKKIKPDYLAVVDVDPESSTYQQVISKCEVTNVGDELHHSGWNTCGSCPSSLGLVRDKLIFPCLLSDRIYIFDTSKGTEVTLFRTIEPKELWDLNVSSPHTSHCLDTGEVMISTMGDKEGNAKGAFIILDALTFNIKRVIEDEACKFGYDFWYQYQCNTLISSQWGAPKHFKDLSHFFTNVKEGGYGDSLDVWTLKPTKFVESIKLGDKGLLPLEVRFLHDPKATEGYVGCALSSTVFRFAQEDGKWAVGNAAAPAIAVDPLEVEGWELGGVQVPNMPGIITDILISLCDKYLFLSNWVHGDIRCYNIENRQRPQLVSQVYIGGSIHQNTSVIIKKPADFVKPKQLVINGKVIQGGPQMLQLSKDGKRLYVTTSLFSVWDKAFYPNLIEEGSYMLKVDVDCGKMKLDENFLVDFKQNNTVYLAHEMRYPGGDCTSDIYK
jgi:selenium-binding protein 1